MALAIAAVLTSWSVWLAWGTYADTPEVADFRRFAEPASSKFETKGSYLFSPVIGGLVALSGVLAWCLPERVRVRLRIAKPQRFGV